MFHNRRLRLSAYGNTGSLNLGKKNQKIIAIESCISVHPVYICVHIYIINISISVEMPAKNLPIQTA